MSSVGSSPIDRSSCNRRKLLYFVVVEAEAEAEEATTPLVVAVGGEANRRAEAGSVDIRKMKSAVAAVMRKVTTVDAFVMVGLIV